MSRAFVLALTGKDHERCSAIIAELAAVAGEQAYARDVLLPLLAARFSGAADLSPRVRSRRPAYDCGLPAIKTEMCVMSEFPRILVQREVLAITRLAHDTLSRLEAKNLFPKRIKIGEKKVGWLETEVSAWLADRLAERFEARPVD